jgi:carbamoyl-phosphate synthase large subunit
VVRPSYVLGGRAMEIVHETARPGALHARGGAVSNDSPVLLDRFLDDAIEVDVDCVATAGRC